MRSVQPPGELLSLPSITFTCEHLIMVTALSQCIIRSIYYEHCQLTVKFGEITRSLEAGEENDLQKVRKNIESFIQELVPTL